MHRQTGKSQRGHLGERALHLMGAIPLRHERLANFQASATEAKVPKSSWAKEQMSATSSDRPMPCAYLNSLSKKSLFLCSVAVGRTG
mmetsp:Transcript_25324/g.37639  ORF Transcript_25324/g.37639 Transcript_25324/m.37639 type:complete len:87 (-) Transcript_25324:3-263(-)